MMGVVPQLDGRARDDVFIANCAQARRSQHERFAMDWLHANPSCGQHPEKMTAGKNQHVAAYCADPAHDTISSSCHLLWRFTAGRAIAEQLPVRAFFQDVNRQAAFVLAVVPLNEISIDFSRRSESGQLTCFSGVSPLRRSPSRSAFASPRLVSGKSVRPVCWPVIVQAVSPCLAR